MCRGVASKLLRVPVNIRAKLGQEGRPAIVRLDSEVMLFIVTFDDGLHKAVLRGDCGLGKLGVEGGLEW